MLDYHEVRDRDIEAKERGKLYADETRGARESEVKEGDRVLLKQEKTNKLTPTFTPEPFHVLDKAGNSIVVESPDGVQYKRNSTHVKKFVERNSLPEGQQPIQTTYTRDSTTHNPPLHADEDDLHKPVELVESALEPSPSGTIAQRPVRTRVHAAITVQRLCYVLVKFLRH